MKKRKKKGNMNTNAKNVKLAKKKYKLSDKNSLLSLDDMNVNITNDLHYNNTMNNTHQKNKPKINSIKETTNNINIKNIHKYKQGNTPMAMTPKNNHNYLQKQPKILIDFNDMSSNSDIDPFLVSSEMDKKRSIKKCINNEKINQINTMNTYTPMSSKVYDSGSKFNNKNTTTQAFFPHTMPVEPSTNEDNEELLYHRMNNPMYMNQNNINNYPSNPQNNNLPHNNYNYYNHYNNIHPHDQYYYMNQNTPNIHNQHYMTDNTGMSYFKQPNTNKYHNSQMHSIPGPISLNMRNKYMNYKK